tara:strand:- start:575 stop:829 length:255 start_codon:yes stop_codon:yes gene_type:complete
MNWKEAVKIKAGAIVRESWCTGNETRTGLVLAKEYQEGEKRETVLMLKRDKRYILTVNWFSTNRFPQKIKKHSSWDVMVIKHTK